MKRTAKLMSVILKQRLRGRGLPGEVVHVKRGYALNFLIPNELAMMATQRNVAILEDKKNEWLNLDSKKQEEGKSLKEKIDKIILDFEHSTVDGFRLYGSISTKEVINKLVEKGLPIKKEDVVMKPIKELGSFKAQVYTHGNEASITINVKELDANAIGK